MTAVQKKTVFFNKISRMYFPNFSLSEVYRLPLYLTPAKDLRYDLSDDHWNIF